MAKWKLGCITYLRMTRDQVTMVIGEIIRIGFNTKGKNFAYLYRLS